jgi:protein-export membrane protein SecD
MWKRNRWKILSIVVVVVAAVYYLIPSVRLLRMSPADREAMDPDALAALEDRSLRMGLDLQGGMHLLLAVDTSDLSEDEARDARDRALQVITNRVDQFGVAEPSIQKQGDDRILIQLPGLQDPERAKNLIGQTARLEFRLLPVADEMRNFLLAADRALSRAGVTAEDEEASMDEAAEAEPMPEDAEASEGEAADDLLPELEVPEMALEPPAEEGTPTAPPDAQLSFYVGEQRFQDGRNADFFVLEKDYDRVRRLIERPEVQAAVPRGHEVLWASELDTRSYRTPVYKLYLVETRAEVTGGDVQNAVMRVGLDPDLPNSPGISMTMHRKGRRRFADLTGSNVGRRLAIVLDGKVYSAPNLRERIPNGVASITGSFDDEEARDLAIVLRAGALPAPIVILEERTVGPSLGHDSIRLGIRAALWGLLAVVAFMALYYQGAGLIAVLAVGLNMALVLACLAWLKATLTLPGIAGLILTVGMAVDANVLIFERIREELRNKKTVLASIDAGYGRAFRTILDANVTTLIAALVLLQFGTGPIKGFAVTLSIGIAASMFTAIVVTRVIFDAFTLGRQVRRLSI